MNLTAPSNFKSYNTVISPQFQDHSSRFSILFRKNRQRVAHIRQEPVFSHYFGAPQPLPSIPQTPDTLIPWQFCGLSIWASRIRKQ